MSKSLRSISLERLRSNMDCALAELAQLQRSQQKTRKLILRSRKVAQEAHRTIAEVNALSTGEPGIARLR
jgi:hypothetical protein